MEGKFIHVRKELDELGYYQPLSKESTPLVERILADLKTTTLSLQKYMRIAQESIEERDNLQLGAQPFKCDNVRLVKECNSLHLRLTKCKEDNDHLQKSLERRIESLKLENLDLEGDKDKLRKQIQNLQVEIHNYASICGPKLKSKPAFKSSSTSALFKGKNPNPSVIKSRNFELNSAMALADQKMTNLTKEIRKLKDQNLQLVDETESLQNQLMNRDHEIARLNSLLEGGRPLAALNKDCCCKLGPDEHCDRLQGDIHKLSQEKHELEAQLKESLGKQHEAMKRALHLAERNKMLENEMKDIDRLALAVEAECNNTVKSKVEMIGRLQDRIHSTVLQIQSLERENSKLKQEKQELNADMDAITMEKKHLQSVLETSLDEKKRLNDKINNFTIIENDLNSEIDRLMQLSANQKRRIAELECNLLSEKAEMRYLSDEIVTSSKKRDSTTESQWSPAKNKGKVGKNSMKNGRKGAKNGSNKSPTRPRSPQSPLLTKDTAKVSTKSYDTKDKSESGLAGRCCRGCCDSCVSANHLKELLDKELDYREQQSNRCLDTLKTEKDYYMKEYHKLLEQFKNASNRTESGKQNGDLLQKLVEKEQSLTSLQQENRILSQEKYTLMSRLETARDRPGDTDLEGVCLKSNCKRTERDRELLRNDVERLEEENDALKRKIQHLSECHIQEREKIQKCLNESEESVRKLEQERRELIQNTGSRHVLEEENVSLKGQLRAAQNELNHQRALYNQVKTLHEQTDRALSDTQGQLVQIEGELADALEKLRKRDHDRGAVNKEADVLRNDLQIMKARLTQIDTEKDELLSNLDEKTERLARLEGELKLKEKTIASLETTVDDLKGKFKSTIDDNATQGHLLRSSQSEMSNLRQELESIKRLKDGTLHENRRLQDDLAAATLDCRDARKELEIYKRQVDDLKTQLQHYVAEVKRTEDLISNKEIERNEILDQYRSLSQEANVLENNNHTLENEATQCRVQLSVALDHAAELEGKLVNQEEIIRSYERQIADLTSQVASLEIQAKQINSDHDRTDFELTNMRELSLKLDTENQKLKRQLRDLEDQCHQESKRIDHLRSERDALQSSAARERHGAESSERLASEAKIDCADLRSLNQELQAEVQSLKSKVQNLQDVLCIKNDVVLFANNDNNDNLSDFHAIKRKLSSTPTAVMVKLNTTESPKTLSKKNLRRTSIVDLDLKDQKSVSDCASNLKKIKDGKVNPICVEQTNSTTGTIFAQSQNAFPRENAENNEPSSQQKDLMSTCFAINGLPVASFTANYTIVHEVPFQTIDSTQHK